MKFFGTLGFYATLKKKMITQNADVVECCAVAFLSFEDLAQLETNILRGINVKQGRRILGVNKSAIL